MKEESQTEKPLTCKFIVSFSRLFISCFICSPRVVRTVEYLCLANEGEVLGVALRALARTQVQVKVAVEEFQKQLEAHLGDCGVISRNKVSQRIEKKTKLLSDRPLMLLCASDLRSNCSNSLSLYYFLSLYCFLSRLLFPLTPIVSSLTSRTDCCLEQWVSGMKLLMPLCLHLSRLPLLLLLSASKKEM